MPTAGVIQGLDGATRLIVSGGWSDAAADQVASQAFDRLEFHGGDYDDFGFLVPYASKIASVAVPNGTWKGAGGLDRLTALRALALGSPLKGVDFSSLDGLRSLSIGGWSASYGKSLFECRRLESLHIEGFADTDCRRIGRLSALQSLSLARGKLETLAGLRDCTSLRSVQLVHLRKLADASDMGSIHTLREVEFVEALPKVVDVRAITACEQLRRLDLRGVGTAFDDVSWLGRMRHLNVLGLSNVGSPDWDNLFSSRDLKKIAIAFAKPPGLSVDDVRAAAIERGLRPTDVRPLGVPSKPIGFVVEFRPEGSTANLWFWRDPS
jgi:hypothetical protein